MTNQQPPSGWNPPQNTAGAPHNGAPAPSAQYGTPHRPQGYPAPNGFSAPQPQRPPSESITVGPFTLRELIIFIAAFLLLVCTFLPILSGDIGSTTNLWSLMWPLVVPGALLPIAAAVLVLIRRLAPGVRLRVGSLSVDQFASVVAIIAAATYLGVMIVVLSIGASLGEVGFFSVSLSFGPLLGILFSLILVVVTTLATLIPPFAADFRGRVTVEAHITARPAKPIVRAPRPVPAPVPGYGPPAPHGAPNGYGQPLQPQPPAAQPAPQPAQQHDASFAPAPYGATQGASPYARQAEPEAAPAHTAPQPEPATEQSSTHQPTPMVSEPVEPQIDEASPVADAADTTPEPEPAAEPKTEPGTEPISAAAHINGSDGQSTTPFWVWSPHPRPVVDETTGAPVFDIGPDAWALAVEDRGEALVVRHDDGRVGILNDVDGLTRG
ncbi:hypothetical protein [Paramicrobacterium fandaimingii]|uniref:hypothetical protein n=1 Tax=Paramicrobacterium fandaimingii TaxID=2708079 RepID=UPI00141FA44D|nr:hypothetical protein [Microbacterium fandaimingii]